MSWKGSARRHPAWSYGQLGPSLACLVGCPGSVLARRPLHRATRQSPEQQGERGKQTFTFPQPGSNWPAPRHSLLSSWGMWFMGNHPGSQPDTHTHTHTELH